MLVLLVGMPVWETPTALPATGLATYYTGGVLEWVYNYRIEQGHIAPCKECVGAVAMLHSGDVGRKVWVQHADETLGPFIVVDCAAPEDYPRLQQRGIIVELPYWVATRWDMTGPTRVRVLDRAPPNRPSRH